MRVSTLLVGLALPAMVTEHHRAGVFYTTERTQFWRLEGQDQGATWSGEGCLPIHRFVIPSHGRQRGKRDLRGWGTSFLRALTPFRERTMLMI